MRALYLTRAAPWSPTFGAEQRAHLLLAALERCMPADVVLAQPGAETRIERGDRPRCLAQVTWAERGGGLAAYRRDPRLSEWAQGAIDWSAYAVVVSRYATPAFKLGVPERLPLIVDVDDAVRRVASPAGGALHAAWVRAKSAVRLRMLRAALRTCKHVFVCAEEDRHAFPGITSSVLPNIPFHVPDAVDAPASSPPVVLFVGALWYAPNRDGLQWFLDRCWAGLRARVPGIRFRIVGGAAPEQRAAWAAIEGVEAPGFVDDLAAEYRRATFAVVPVWEGAGSNIKLLEALAHGRACVTTPVAYEPFRQHLRAGEAVFVARSDAETIEACCRLASDDALRRTAAQAGRASIAAHYSRERFDEIVREALGAALAGRTGAGALSPERTPVVGR